MEKHGKEIVLKAMGQAISKTVAISEIIKKRVPGLHQDTSISSVSITDVWEPIEKGLVSNGSLISPYVAFIASIAPNGSPSMNTVSGGGVGNDIDKSRRLGFFVDTCQIVT